MKKSIIYRTVYSRVARLSLAVLLIAAFFVACKKKVQPKESSAKVVKAPTSKAYYTCSMHPQVHEDHPGNCPVCGMNLIKVEVSQMSMSMGGNRVLLTKTQMQLGGIKTDTVKEQNTGEEKSLTGTVTTNENKTDQLSARIAGRIQRLFVRTTGETIRIGQPIYTVYSEDLLEAEKEYLLAKEQAKKLNNPDVDYQQLIAGAENKLLLWGLTRVQIRELAKTGEASAMVTMLSTIGGTVADVMVHEGDYVSEGMPILKTQALNSLWVEAQLYASETGSYRDHDPVNVSFPDLGGQSIKGTIDFINPELSGFSKVDLIRVTIPNPQGLIRPGMQAYVSAGGGEKRSLAVPASAVIYGGKGDLVWVKNADGSFSARIIKTGPGNSSYVSVLSGLTAGEVVVTGGAYLLNSEASFGNSDGQMNMSGMDSKMDSRMKMDPRMKM
ncbi:efflux RND transporter periplasmic adaptor subunit [Mucilaginibacter sabulilitoris]|uniref:Efflux RND transporter periplasmic adaptor subunit n=1 Tax=Mucilaginibacter sabulilitoris TaxID=1173583 RepID=A0ABZ0TU32_9SPHI|nr:efflux RND transporter periplasmic adaptor subunit [Mucilaginibacter sabulilitoris]WPU94675.1 efflux RND transporter periplasmic adaptor subunit [Mucilaginibacter sabulilitoris]